MTSEESVAVRIGATLERLEPLERLERIEQSEAIERLDQAAIFNVDKTR